MKSSSCSVRRLRKACPYRDRPGSSYRQAPQLAFAKHFSVVEGKVQPGGKAMAAKLAVHYLLVSVQLADGRAIILATKQHAESAPLSF